MKTHEAVGRWAATSSPTSTRRSTRPAGSRCRSRPGVKLHDLLTVNLSAGTIDHVINDTGAPVNNDAIGVPSYVVSFP